MQIGTWPVEPGQSVWVAFRVEHLDGTRGEGREEAAWQRNAGPNSYWQAWFGPFVLGDRVTYTVHGRSPDGEVTAPTASFRVAPKVYLAILWHQHQPVYEGLSDPLGPRRARQPWVRLHAIRDYYSMAALVAEHPRVYLTINLTPSLLRQIEDYAERRVTDPALELTLTPAERLAGDEREEVLGTFFEADWHHQIFPFPRYRELFTRRQARKRFSAQDLRDLQMWFNLAWFGSEFREGTVTLATGEAASVRRFVEQGRGFSADDIQAMVEEQYKILRAVIRSTGSSRGGGRSKSRRPRTITPSSRCSWIRIVPPSTGPGRLTRRASRIPRMRRHRRSRRSTTTGAGSAGRPRVCGRPRER